LFLKLLQGLLELNSIIGEDAAISIKVGAQARLPGGKKLGEDEIQVRGATADVKRAIEEIQRIVENAKQYGLEHSHVSSPPSFRLDEMLITSFTDGGV